jgi:flagellar basal-body rod protein FlgB
MLLKEALYTKTAIPTVSKSLDACMLRSRAIANNLANVNTPGYQRIEVEFESKLRDAMDEQKLSGTVDQFGHMALGRARIDQIQPVAYRSQDPTLPGEINNVDVDIEAAKLAENQLLYSFGIRFIQSRKSDIENAIKGQPS